MRKVFIIGAHRSGTSKIASYFSDVLGFAGYAEGHAWRFLASLQDGRAEITRTIPESAYEVNRIGMDTVLLAMTRTLDSLVLAHHGGRDYYDKTPGFRMIDTCPLIARHIPEAQFIHMHRNGIENVKSNLRLWPNRHFDDACRMWSAPIKSFHAVRGELGARMISFDMADFLIDPWNAHGRILAHLGLDPRWTEDEVRAYFATGSNSSTGEVPRGRIAPTLAAQSWTEAQKACFREICGPQMEALGYAM
ncbi:sulfotransferase [Falsirhodobacter algicola]|uniref:Sulfotransferase family protein n=1 Tax=Falsirhodobacter algicola TaxID=2692330 RepID=A0A8J8SL56_9RHOB|nr:sulfotransferase [Falsirhodobacter algicola]QUS36086.1 hypothetical protein GR316_07270 [Falsirhodobacter algicola]